jgi:beta-lactamase regulating signal transducer with metallopeptidase domain
LNWPLLVAYVFLASAMACAAWVVAGWIALRRVLARARRPEAWLQNLFQECQVEPCSRVRLLVSDRASRPLTCGWPRPTIVLPGFLGWEWSAALACVLRHELVHARRGDPLGQLLFCGALPLVYWHPLYWFLRRSVARSRELVADDEASAPIGRRHYARHMVCLARRCRSGDWSLGTVGMFRSTTQFFWRMNMLLHRSHSLASRSTRTWRWLSTATCVLVVAAAATLWGVRASQAQPAPEDPPTGGPAQPSPTTPAPGGPVAPPPTTPGPSVGAALDPTDDPSTDPVPPKASNQVAGDPDQPPRNRKELRRDILKRVEQLLNELEEPGDTVSPELNRFDKMLRELVDQNRKRRAGGPVTVPGPGAGLPSAEPSRTPALPGGPPAVVEPNYRRGARATAALGTVARSPYAHQVGGADVGASDVLAFAANFATAQAEHTVAEAEVRAVEQSLRDDPDKNLSRELSFKRAALKAAREKSRLFVRVADIARESAKAELQSAQEELDQLRQLHKTGVIPHTQVTRAQRTQAQAESRLKILASLVEDTPAKAEEPAIRSR